MSKRSKEVKEEEIIDLTDQEAILMPSQIPDMSLGDVSTKEESVAKVIILLAQADKRKMMSEVKNEDRIIKLSCLYTASEILKDDYKEISRGYERFCDEYLELMISLGRKGRKEIGKVAASLSAAEEKRGMFSRLNPFMWGRG
jgi:hypothetical protein